MHYQGGVDRWLAALVVAMILFCVVDVARSKFALERPAGLRRIGLFAVPVGVWVSLVPIEIGLLFQLKYAGPLIPHAFLSGFCISAIGMLLWNKS
jgi:hypothetical protein